jgi:hypothetical protein
MKSLLKAFFKNILSTLNRLFDRKMLTILLTFLFAMSVLPTSCVYDPILIYYHGHTGMGVLLAIAFIVIVADISNICDKPWSSLKNVTKHRYVVSRIAILLLAVALLGYAIALGKFAYFAIFS